MSLSNRLRKAGEGEHKIFKLINEINEIRGFDENENIIINGLDADLIILSLISGRNNIYLMRENRGIITYVNINNLKSAIIKELRPKWHIGEDKDFVINYPDYETAAKYVYILTQVFSGSKPETSNFIDLKGKYKSKYLTFRDKLSKPDWIEHFLRITNVENMDFEKVIEKYDSESTYIYLDPPYWKTENYYSNHDFDRNDHERLANVLKNVKGKFSLSYYDFPILSEWFPKDQYRWESKEFAKAAAAKKGVKQNGATELLIMNY